MSDRVHTGWQKLTPHQRHLALSHLDEFDEVEDIGTEDILAGLGPSDCRLALMFLGEPTSNGPDRGAEMVSGMTLEEVAVEMGVSRERIRQIEIKALDKLRRAIRRGVFCV